MLNDITQRSKSDDIEVGFTKNVVDTVTGKGFDPVYGARPLRRAVTSLVEDVLAEKYLSGEIRTGESILCDYENGELKILKK